ncbi:MULTISPECIES: hypothetical protein [Variovorax]|uniref:Transmembrane protein n=1 Tax=Variovorax paradoxus TaxID=34073 RepID=A0AA91DGL3_VARPD|nr:MULTISPECIES: hypothetical protein [Variovorax]AVQ80585.1 hypothetical protein C4F17_06245 [Variovorax sp. PMC12]OAK54155.1 hypothetical protein A3K87_31875 [Variovorax paradoxus]QRY29997.1 hypothetical protein JVX96_18030 [Variovorax sp. PDNC026]
MSRWRLALLLLMGVAYAGLSHWMTLFHATEPWAVVVLLGPLWLAAVGFAASRFGGWGCAGAVALGIAGFVLVFLGEAGDPNRLYVLQHVGINALLCGWFGSTLRGRGLPLITQFAQRVHPLKGHMLAYTTQLTRIWTAYFAVVVLASIAIYLTRPFADWSLFANVLSPIMVGVLFVGEHLVRYRLHPEFERTRLVDAVRAFYGTSSVDSSAGGQ